MDQAKTTARRCEKHLNFYLVSLILDVLQYVNASSKHFSTWRFTRVLFSGLYSASFWNRFKDNTFARALKYLPLKPIHHSTYTTTSPCSAENWFIATKMRLLGSKIFATCCPDQHRIVLHSYVKADCIIYPATTHKRMTVGWLMTMMCYATNNDYRDIIWQRYHYIILCAYFGNRLLIVLNWWIPINQIYSLKYANKQYNMCIANENSQHNFQSHGGLDMICKSRYSSCDTYMSQCWQKRWLISQRSLWGLCYICNVHHRQTVLSLI